MELSQPVWLIGGFGVCLALFWFFRTLAQKRQAALERFAAQQLLSRLTGNISTPRRYLKKLLLLLAVFLCFVALARPQVGYQWVEVKRKGIDLLFALDTSKSMLVEDIKPNRLQRATLAILDFVEKLEGDRVGLLPFAGSAYLMCPLTIDYDAFLDSLSAINTDLIPQGGTNIAAVIDKAVQTLNNAANHKILIIVTDGENLQGDVIRAAEAAAKEGLTIYTIGVGTSQGELIPNKKGHSQGFVTDQAGNYITSRLDEATLGQIAEKSGGLYAPLGPAGEGLETIYQQKLALIPKEELAERRQKVPIDRFEWPLALATILLMAELLIGERKSPLTLPLLPWARSLLARIKWQRAGKILGFALLLLATTTGSGYASQGEEAYQRGDYLGASEYFRKKLEKNPDDPVLHYNFGTAAYKNNLFDDAIGAFGEALKSDRVDLQKKAYFNRGNSYYQKGAEQLQADRKAAAAQWRQAVNSLKSALELDPDDVDATNNHRIVSKKLEELEEELKKEQQQKNSQNEQKGEEDEDKKAGEQSPDQQSGPGESETEGQQQEQKEQQGKDEQQNAQEGEEQTAEQAGEEQPQDAEPQPSASELAREEKSDATEQAARDAARQQLGKMTKEEAEQLLNALKNEEGNLNFVPSRRSKDQPIDRDW